MRPHLGYLCPNVVMFAEARASSSAHKWSNDPYRPALSQPRRGSCPRSQVLLGYLWHVPVADQTVLGLGNKCGLNHHSEMARKTGAKGSDSTRMLSLFEKQEEGAVQRRLKIH